MKLISVLCFVFVSCLIAQSNGLGASSLFGVDYGTDVFKVMVLQGNAPDIVLNDQSGRKTDTLIGFSRDGERVFGSRAAQLRTKYPDRVISAAHHFLGKSYPDDVIENNRHLYPTSLVNNNGTYGFQIDDTVYSPEEIVAMILEFAHRMATSTTSRNLVDLAIVVPPYLTQSERQGFINAGKIAGLNVIALTHEGTAAAVQHLRSRLLGEENYDNFTIFFDVGHSHSSASLVRFSIDKSKTRDKSINRKIITNVTTWEDVGGRDFDYRLTRFLVEEAEKQFNEDFSNNKRVLARLEKEARKAKEVLSANKEVRVRIESLSNDRDFSTIITRDGFEEMCADLFEKVMKPIHQLFEESVVSLDDVDIEVIGGGSRVTKINQLLSDLFGERVGRHLNGDESALSGALLYAATGTAGKKSAFVVKDTINRDIDISYDLPQQESDSLFHKASRLRTHKNKNVLAMDTFNCNTFYSDSEILSSGVSPKLGSFEISGFPDFTNIELAEEPTVKVRFDIDARGVISLTEAAIRIDEYVEEVVPIVKEVEVDDNNVIESENEDNIIIEEAEEGEINEDEEENEEGEKDEEEGSTEEGEVIEEEEQEQEEIEEENEEIVEEQEFETQLTTKRRILQLKYTQTENIIELSESDILTSRDVLQKLNHEDEQRLLREATKNELESYVYTMLDALEEEGIKSVTTEDERELFSTGLLEAGDWLYDDGASASLEEYQEKLGALKEVGDRMQLRSSELEMRPAVASAFHEWKDTVLEILSTIVTERNVGEGERDELVQEIRDLEGWLESQQEEQAKKQPFEDPVWISSDLYSRMAELQNTVNRFQKRRIRTPTPTPTPEVIEEEKENFEIPPNFEFDFNNLNFDLGEEPIDIDSEQQQEELKNEDSENDAKPIHEEL